MATESEDEVEQRRSGGMHGGMLRMSCHSNHDRRSRACTKQFTRCTTEKVSNPAGNCSVATAKSIGSSRAELPV